MGTAMKDLEFLAYCERNSYTPRCGFTPGLVQRLCALAEVPPSYICPKFHIVPENRMVIDCSGVWVRQAALIARRKVLLKEIVRRVMVGPPQHFLRCNACAAQLLKDARKEWNRDPRTAGLMR